MKRGALTEQREYATLLCQFSTELLTCQLLAIAVVCEVVGQLETAIDKLREHKLPPVVAEAFRLQQNSSVHLLQLQQKYWVTDDSMKTTNIRLCSPGDM